MKMDPNAAQTLRKLFITHAGQYPYLLPEAEILFESAGGSKMKFHAANPYETAKVLMHCVQHDGNGIFNRKLGNGSIAPLSILMHKRVRLAPDNKEHCMKAFQLTYQDLGESGHLQINDPQINDYFWRGEERIDKGTAMTFHAPKMSDLIETLWRAGDRWQHVNFISHTPKLTLHVNPALRDHML